MDEPNVYNSESLEITDVKGVKGLLEDMYLSEQLDEHGRDEVREQLKELKRFEDRKCKR